MSNRKKIKHTDKEKYIRVGDWIIDISMLEKKMFLHAMNIKTNSQLLTYCADGMAILYKRSADELEHRLNIASGLVSSMIMSDDPIETLEMGINLLNEVKVKASDVSEEEDQKIIAEMKKEYMMREVLESKGDAELLDKVASGEINVNNLIDKKDE